MHGSLVWMLKRTVYRQIFDRASCCQQTVLSLVGGAGFRQGCMLERDCSFFAPLTRYRYRSRIMLQRRLQHDRYLNDGGSGSFMLNPVVGESEIVDDFAVMDGIKLYTVEDKSYNISILCEKDGEEG